MPRMRMRMKEVPNWDYPEAMQELMREFETAIEGLRRDIAKAGKNLVAGRRARLTLQQLRNNLGVRVRQALFNERDRLQALRHGMSVIEWNERRDGED